MQMTIKKWGNSLATRIPKVIVESIDLHNNQTVEIEAINGKIIITPVEDKKSYKLADLLQQCEPESIEIDDDDKKWLNSIPIGREAW